MSQVHPVLLRGLLTEAAGEVGAVLGRWPGARRRGAHSAEKEAGDSLLTPPVPTDAWAIARRVLRDSNGLFDGGQQP